jgi:hypothetical protein
MTSSRTHPAIRRAVIVFATASSLGVAACSMTTSPEVVAAPSRSLSRAPGTTSEPASNLEPPLMVQVPSDIDPDADAANPVEVAEAFVTTLTNRAPTDSDAGWRQRWSRWTTPELSAAWGDDRGADAYRVEVEGRHGFAVGTIVGSAVYDCDDTHCSVDVVADQTLVLDGHALNERNFVTWRLKLRREGAGWLVEAVAFGAGS